MRAADCNSSTNAQLPSKPGLALVIQADGTARTELTGHLIDLGFAPLVSSNGGHACGLLEENKVAIVFMSTLLEDTDCSELVRSIKRKSAEKFVPVVVLDDASDSECVRSCIEAGADDLLSVHYTPAELGARVKAMEQRRELRDLYENSIHEQVVAKQILSVALKARSTDIEGVQIFTRAAAIFSGDLVLTAHSPGGGVNILLADFTGHGLSAAICVLPVADMFSVMTEKGFTPEIIIKNINEKLFTLLPTGMFMAASMIAIDKSKNRAFVLNCGMPDVHLLGDKAGRIKGCVKSNCIPLGIEHHRDGRLSFEEFDIEAGDYFILHSDGLADAVGVSGKMFGEQHLETIIRQHADSRVFETIVSEFDRFSSTWGLSDDVTLVAVECRKVLAGLPAEEETDSLRVADSGREGWRFVVEVTGASLKEMDPVSVITGQYSQLDDPPVSAAKLHSILAALYDNALNHGVLEMSHFIDASLSRDCDYEQERDRRLEEIPYAFVRVELRPISFQGKPSLLLRLSDSGRGFDHVSFLDGMSNRSVEEQCRPGSGIQMVRDLCQSMVYLGNGSRVEVILAEQNTSGAGS